MLTEILKPVNIIVMQLQSSSENIVSALPVVNAVRDEVKMTREALDEEKCEKMVEKLKNSEEIVEIETKVKRKTSAPIRLGDYFVTEHIPSVKPVPSSRYMLSH